jgi:hypothetical protein
MTLLSKRDRTELSLLAGGLLVVLGVLLFVQLADLVREVHTQGFDERVLRAFRRADDPSTPIGPRWLRGAALDITALGSAAVLGLAVAAIVGFLLLQGLRRTALFVFLASAGGWLLNAPSRVLPAPPSGCRTALARGAHVEFSERPRDDVGSRLPDARRHAHADCRAAHH